MLVNGIPVNMLMKFNWVNGISHASDSNRITFLIPIEQLFLNKELAMPMPHFICDIIQSTAVNLFWKEV